MAGQPLSHFSGSPLSVHPQLSSPVVRAGISRISRRVEVAVGVLIVSSLLPAVTVGGVEMSGALICESNEAALAGYYNKEVGRPAGAMKESAALHRQQHTS